MLKCKKYLIEVQTWSRYFDEENFDVHPICVWSTLEKARECCEHQAKRLSELYEFHWEGNAYVSNGIANNGLQTGVSYIITEIASF